MWIKLLPRQSLGSCPAPYTARSEYVFGFGCSFSRVTRAAASTLWMHRLFECHSTTRHNCYLPSMWGTTLLEFQNRALAIDLLHGAQTPSIKSPAPSRPNTRELMRNREQGFARHQALASCANSTGSSTAIPPEHPSAAALASTQLSSIIGPAATSPASRGAEQADLLAEGRVDQCTSTPKAPGPDATTKSNAVDHREASEERRSVSARCCISVAVPEGWKISASESV